MRVWRVWRGLHAVGVQLRLFPWRNTALTLRERFREDKLGVAAGSLTFTTTLSVVPLMTVALAIFSAFPMFARMERALNTWLFQGLVPQDMARQVSSYMLQFTHKAGQMGWAGALVLLISALALVLTIDRKLNDIWRVRRLRPFHQRIVVYWGLLTLGPLLVGFSLTLSSYALSVSRGWVGSTPGWLLTAFDLLEFGAVLMAVTALYRWVPNTRVRWQHAMAGAVCVAVAFDLAKRMLVWYVATVPTYSVVYGTFATVPILLIWLYLLWVIVLLGAVVAAYLPSLMAGVARRGDSPGWSFQLALEVLALLHHGRSQGRAGWSADDLAAAMQVDRLQLEPPLDTLRALDWIGCLADEEARFVLLVELHRTPAAPLIEQLLLPPGPTTEPVWQRSAWRNQTVAALVAAQPPDGISAA